ncbi:MAG: RHS repeat-associated core domain-containing protein [Chloroflexi bacterium]|nr:RHS repeat-associated core domain-containing protein [Chloroflexota bacterium]
MPARRCGPATSRTNTSPSTRRIGRKREHPHPQPLSLKGRGARGYRLTEGGQRRESATLGINLYDYGARFYSAFTGRFISADSIVSGAGNPQALNRYSYGLNNPVRYTDPSGHKSCDDEDCNKPPEYDIDINFVGEWEGQQIAVIMEAAMIVERNLRRADRANARAAAHQGEDAACTLCGLKPGEAWRATFGQVKVIRVNRFDFEDTQSVGAYASSAHTIEFYNGAFQSAATGKAIPFTVHHPLHEMGHLFDLNVAGGRPSGDLSRDIITNGLGVPVVSHGSRVDGGFAPYPFQQNTFQNTSGETFADMFLNWNLNSFTRDPQGAGAALYTWMNSNMPGWIPLAVRNNR